jgi:osmotically-inducible protein OsmY
MKSDAELQKDVMTELKWEPSVAAAEIGIAVKDGIVTMTGYVDSYFAKSTVERTAARVFGVRAVAGEIKVRFPGSFKRTDEDIAGAAVYALEWNVSVPHDRVKVSVQDGLAYSEWRGRLVVPEGRCRRCRAEIDGGGRSQQPHNCQADGQTAGCKGQN